MHHERAIKIHQYLRRSHKKLVITDVVVNETLGALKRRFKEKKEGNFRKVAEKIVAIWEKEKVYFYLYVFSAWKEIIELVLSSEGNLNFHDALLIVGARKRGIDTIVTFDSDFREYMNILEIH